MEPTNFSNDKDIVVPYEHTTSCSDNDDVTMMTIETFVFLFIMAMVMIM